MAELRFLLLMRIASLNVEARSSLVVAFKAVVDVCYVALPKVAIPYFLELDPELFLRWHEFHDRPGLAMFCPQLHGLISPRSNAQRMISCYYKRIGTDS